MSANFVQSRTLRAVAIGGLRLNARARFWRKGPRILVNSIPKAGTHLLTSVLGQTGGLQNSHLWLDRRQAKVVDGEVIANPNFDARLFRRQIGQVRGSQFCVAHLHYRPEMMRILEEENFRSICLIRHPLDIAVSLFHYIGGLRRHLKHTYFASLPSDDDRIDYIMNGSPIGPQPALKTILQAHSGWLHAPDVLVVRFEDLVGARGGGSDAVRDETWHKLMLHCGLDDAEVPQPAPTQRSATFRSGKINAYSSLFDERRVAKLDEETKAAIHAYGYSI